MSGALHRPKRSHPLPHSMGLEEEAVVNDI